MSNHSRWPFIANPITGFAQPCGGNEVVALVDGKEAMRMMYDAMMKAEQYVYIADWQMVASVPLIRDVPSHLDEFRVGNVLGDLAVRKDLDVRVILYEPPFIPRLEDGKTLAELWRKGVKAFRHRPSLYYSNHQKILVVDGTVAFLGGIDLTVGRWDTDKHLLLDRQGLYEDSKKPYKEADYRNPTIPKCDRERHPRLPWHDVHCKIEGPAVRDITGNFVERWSNTKPLSLGYEKIDVAAPCYEAKGKQWVQIVRSLSKKTGASDGKTEKSIADAYCKAIAGAEKFVYIENQYFISKAGEGKAGPQNPIMETLAQRIIKAIEEKKEFLAILVLPIMPEGELSSWAEQEQMHWQFRTLQRDKNCKRQPWQEVQPLYQRLEKATRDDPSRYLSIHYLRNWEKQERALVTEQIYVHAKTMIVDDRIAIIGSANINDRSMLGDRDSEIAAVVYDEDARFAKELRLKLWQEHLGPLTKEEKQQIEDPLAGYAIWKRRSQENTQRFLQCFPFLPRNDEKKLPKKDAQLRRAVPFDQEKQASLEEVRGHLVDFPLHWLEEENLETTGYLDNVFKDPGDFVFIDPAHFPKKDSAPPQLIILCTEDNLAKADHWAKILETPPAPVIWVGKELPPVISGDTIAVYFGSSQACKDERLNEALTKLRQHNVQIIPVVENPEQLTRNVPEILSPFTVFPNTRQSLEELASHVRQILGVEVDPNERRVFISYCREDGQDLARRVKQELEDCYGYQADIEHSDPATGSDPDSEIEKRLSGHYALLYIETPQAYGSQWIYHEICGALRQNLAVMVLQVAGPNGESIEQRHALIESLPVREFDRAFGNVHNVADELDIHIAAAHAENIRIARDMEHYLRQTAANGQVEVDVLPGNILLATHARSLDGKRVLKHFLFWCVPHRPSPKLFQHLGELYDRYLPLEAAVLACPSPSYPLQPEEHAQFCQIRGERPLGIVERQDLQKVAGEWFENIE